MIQKVKREVSRTRVRKLKKIVAKTATSSPFPEIERFARSSSIEREREREKAVLIP